MKKFLIPLNGLLLYLFLVSGCTHLEPGPDVKLNTAASWVVLPLRNLSETPLAAQRVEAILLSMLQKASLPQLLVYPETASDNFALMLNDARRLDLAKQWAKTEKINYGIGGSVQEWQYKTGLDGEPTVGITLAVIDLNDNRVIWTATASRTGWGSENLTETTSLVLRKLIANMQLQP